MKINLDESFKHNADVKLKEICDWNGTQEEWESYIERLVMEDIGNC